MRASRLLSILLLLQARGRMTASQLAGEFEVSVRTIYRDIDDLSASGVPVYSERGPDGGYRLLEGYHTRLTGLTAPEADALFLLGLPGPAADLGLAEVAAAAQLKLRAALPDDRRRGAERISARFHLDPAGWYQEDDSLAFLPALASAVWDNRRIKVFYESWSSTSERMLDPLGVVLKGGSWYLAAGGTDGRCRTYKVASFRAVDVTEETFTRPDSFELKRYWRESTREFEEGRFRGKARLKVSDAGFRQLARMEPAVRRMAEQTRTSAGGDGWFHLSYPIESIEHASVQLAGLGADAEVLAPPALRAKMLDLSGRMLALYSP